MKTLINLMRLLWLLGLPLYASMASSQALAQCTMPYINDGKSYYTATVTGFAPNSFNPYEYKNGFVIHRQTLTLIYSNISENPQVRCDRPTYAYSTGIGTAIEPNIYPASIPKIGIKINFYGGYAPARTTQFFTAPGELYRSLFNYAPVTIELIKTGNEIITAGGTLSLPFLQFRAGSSTGQLLAEISFASPVIVQPLVPTCSASTTTVAVSMPKAAIPTMTQVGDAAPSTPFNITLNCQGGAPATATRAYITLTDDNNRTSTGKVLSITKSNSPTAPAATGVGIEILKDGVALAFGPDSSAVGNTNQWFAGRIPQGQRIFDIPLTARYVRTSADKMTPGPANARATFTLSYQ